MVYDGYADPYQHVSLAGRATSAKQAEELRSRLLARINEAAGEEPVMDLDAQGSATS
jgi:hypothetical protein